MAAEQAVPLLPDAGPLITLAYAGRDLICCCASAGRCGWWTRKAGLGELAMQEAINQLALLEPPQTAVLPCEDHKIARTAFLLPGGTLRVSTRAFLIFLEEKGWLASAAEVEQGAIRAGRVSSRLRFP